MADRRTQNQEENPDGPEPGTVEEQRERLAQAEGEAVLGDTEAKREEFGTVTAQDGTEVADAPGEYSAPPMNDEEASARRGDHQPTNPVEDTSR